MKRFWREVAVRADPTGAIVLLDGRTLRTPGRAVLLCPTAALAEAVAAEWRDAGETLVLETMRLTRLANTVVDLMPARRADAIGEAAGYAAHDLLCYRADAPAALVARQEALWQPWLDWTRHRYDVSLVTTRTLAPVAQPAASLRTLGAVVAAQDDWRLVGLHALATGTGSLVLALAVLEGALDAAGAFEAALLDELFEIACWGAEEEQQRRHERLRADLAAAGCLLELLAASSPRPGRRDEASG